MNKSHVTITLDTAHLRTPDATGQLRQFFSLLVRQLNNFKFLRQKGISHVELFHNHADSLYVLRRAGHDQDVAGFVGSHVEARPGVALGIDRHKGPVDDF